MIWRACIAEEHGSSRRAVGATGPKRLQSKAFSAKRRLMRSYFSAAGILVMFGLLSSCAEPPPAPTRAPPAPMPPASPPPAPAGDWRDAPLNRGSWRYRADGNSSTASYQNAESGNLGILDLACQRSARTITLTFPAAILGDISSGNITLLSTFGEKQYVIVPLSGQTAQISIRTSAADGFLDTLAYSRGRFAVAVAGQTRLILPAWPEFARVIEDCRA